MKFRVLDEDFCDFSGTLHFFEPFNHDQAKQQGVVHAQTPIDGASGAASTRSACGTVEPTVGVLHVVISIICLTVFLVGMTPKEMDFNFSTFFFQLLDFC